MSDYLVEMKLVPTATIPSPQEGIAFTERFVLPTLEACEALVASGRIVAGGPTLAATSFAFVARVESPAQLEEVVNGLPIWPRCQTTVVPLGTFRDRADFVRQGLAKRKAAIQQPELTGIRN